jgi:uncharacterized protein YajQ (UPF0234 family)
MQELRLHKKGKNMPSFDVVSQINHAELNNAVDQATKELNTRFDFKDSPAKIHLSEQEIIIEAEDAFKISQVNEILTNKLTKRGLDPIILGEKHQEKIGGAKMKETIKLKEGIDQKIGKEIGKLIKDSKIKAQSSIQGDTVRISGNKKDDLQAVIKLLEQESSKLAIGLQFINFRD